MSKLHLLILPLLCLQLVVPWPDQPPHCHEDEAIALVEFKDSLAVDQFCKDNGHYRDSYVAYVDRKLELWKLEGNCCTWGGIQCDVRNGHVIGLDLSQSCLHEISINSSSSLFRLLHLQKLNLAFNGFSFSKIPEAIGNFSSLTSLNLSMCSLTGQTLTGLLGLTNMTSLDLSGNSCLSLNLENLAQTLTKLEQLHLHNVNVSSQQLPHAIANLSSLKVLDISSCGLQGELPATIFKLPKLQVLDVSFNFDLSVHLPVFRSNSQLEHLALHCTNVSGELPYSLGNLASLTVLSLRSSGLVGSIPSSIGNLTKLTVLDLSANELEGPLPASFGNLSQLVDLDMSHNQLTGPIPSSFGNLINLENLEMRLNQLSGHIPSSFGDGLVNLKYVDLHSNQLSGQIPSSFGNLINLEVLELRLNQLTGQVLPQLSNFTYLHWLDLACNKLCGTVHLDMFSGLKYLTVLVLSSNDLSVLIANSNVTASYSGRLEKLGLGSCKLLEVPKMIIIQNQETLAYLDLSDNDIHGVVPMWFLDASMERLTYLNISHNFLTSFPRNPIILFKWPSLATLDFSFNKLQGSLPLPVKTIEYYLVSGNKLSGDISPLICNTSIISVLDLSNNKLTGSIPQCLSNSTDYLRILSLRGNYFFGRIPDMLKGRCEELSMIDLSNNQLDGPLPRSLSSCVRLQFLNLGNNMLSDVFPSWLGSLHALRVLILRSNKFHGVVIQEPKIGLQFFNLQILDLSHNYFEGSLPSEYFQSWNSTISPQGYLTTTVQYYTYFYLPYFYYTMTLINKGIKMDYPKILDNFKGIDLSSNNFCGPIPASIRDVRGLHLLNLSNNHLTGPIPPALGDLMDLETLDLSANSLSGDIPQQLEQLNFLEIFNVSGNNLSGPIPRGKQFNTFENNSYEGNEGLCGDPLSRKCGNSLEPPPSTLQKGRDDEDSEMPFYIEWKDVTAGYISAFIIVALIGHRTITVRQNWFVIIFRLREQRRSGHTQKKDAH